VAAILAAASRLFVGNDYKAMMRRITRKRCRERIGAFDTRIMPNASADVLAPWIISFLHVCCFHITHQCHSTIIRARATSPRIAHDRCC